MSVKLESIHRCWSQQQNHKYYSKLNMKISVHKNYDSYPKLIRYQQNISMIYVVRHSSAFSKSKSKRNFSWWRHQMETFSALLAICVGNSPVTGEFRAWLRALMLPLICAWINGWVYNCEASDFRRHRAHYDVTAMLYLVLNFIYNSIWSREVNNLKHILKYYWMFVVD